MRPRNSRGRRCRGERRSESNCSASTEEPRGTGIGSMKAASGGGSRRLSCSTLAGCASMRKSRLNCPDRDASKLRRTARNIAPPASASSV